jgi:Zn finger protein HypA/HybF involved in hydrogenase expression
MHEIVFANSVLREIENSKEENKEIISVDLELGELVGIEKEELQETLEKMSPYKYEIKLTESEIECDCGYAGPALIKERLHDLVIFSCPKCDSTPQVREGNKIKISKIVYK